MKATVDGLAAKVKDLNTRICGKTIGDERAFVMQLHYRRAYVELRHQLTDPRTYVCRIYGLLDELFALYAWDACVAGAIAWLEKAKQLEDERKQGKDAESASRARSSRRPGCSRGARPRPSASSGRGTRTRRSRPSSTSAWQR